MPHVSSSGGGDDLGSEDEVKVFKDEGEEEKRSSENLTEDKSDLIDLTESEEKGTLAGGTYATGKTSARSDLSPVFGKSLVFFFLSNFPGFICLDLLREPHVRGYHKNLKLGGKSENFAIFWKTKILDFKEA
ncbi:Protein pangolin, isoforms A/H/I [Acromyrmex echinatior]|uniref:Protein pangolin, isoforms A/H/I n=1 Tax=Acromyrmex echinatior TaxID=103372 RepID=F4WZR8_ACREC|nr:Protein pangolin, isoforms A/H/I [Acromyrmex echinatior]